MPEVGNWTVEQCSTEGDGTLILIGTDLGLARWRDSLNAGQVYYAIQDGINKEAGIGTFNGINQITRDTVTATLVNNIYNDNNPDPIDLSGASIVSCSLNKAAYDVLVTGIADNAAAIASNIAAIAANVSDISDNTAAIALRATTDYVDAADALKYDKEGGVLSGSVIVGDGSSGGAGGIYIRAYGILDGTFCFLRPDESVAGLVRWVNDEESIDIIQYGYDTNLETIVSVKNGNVRLTGIDVLVPTHDGHLTHKKYVDDADALKLDLTGGTLTGNTVLNNGTNVSPKINIEDETNDRGVEFQVANGQFRIAAINGGAGFLVLNLDIINNRFNFLTAVTCSVLPTNPTDLTRKDYVDGKFSAGLTGTYAKANITSMTFTDGLLTDIVTT